MTPTIEPSGGGCSEAGVTLRFIYVPGTVGTSFEHIHSSQLNGVFNLTRESVWKITQIVTLSAEAANEATTVELHTFRRQWNTVFTV
jgi:hypothetical protein